MSKQQGKSITNTMYYLRENWGNKPGNNIEIGRVSDTTIGIFHFDEGDYEYGVYGERLDEFSTLGDCVAAANKRFDEFRMFDESSGRFNVYLDDNLTADEQNQIKSCASDRILSVFRGVTAPDDLFMPDKQVLEMLDYGKKYCEEHKADLIEPVIVPSEQVLDDSPDFE